MATNAGKCLDEWQAMIDAVRSDTRLRLLIVRNYPLWKVPQINPDYRGL